MKRRKREYILNMIDNEEQKIFNKLPKLFYRYTLVDILKQNGMINPSKNNTYTNEYILKWREEGRIEKYEGKFRKIEINKQI